MTDCFRAAALTAWSNFISWNFPSVFDCFIGKCSQSADAGGSVYSVYYILFFFAGREVSGCRSPSAFKNQAVTFQGRRKDLRTVLIRFSCLQEAGESAGCSQWVGTGGFERSFLQAGNLKPSLLPIPSAGLSAQTTTCCPWMLCYLWRRAQQQQKRKIIRSCWVAEVLDVSRDCRVRSVMVCEPFGTAVRNSPALLEMYLVLVESWWCLKWFCEAK